MPAQVFTDEILMAYADGELDPETARAVEAAAQVEHRLARRIALFRETGDALARASAARNDAPVPESVMSRVRETLAATRVHGEAGEVEPFGRAAPRPGQMRRRAWRAWQPAAIAASVALAAGLGIGLLVDPALSPGDPSPRFATLHGAGIDEALSRLDAGERARVAAGEVAIASSFRTETGDFCREFEVYAPDRGYVGVACHDGAAWELRFAMLGSSGGGEGYAPASSLEALDAWLASIGAGAPLGPEEEAAALGGIGG